MAGIKKYDIDGVADTLQLGKQGPHLAAAEELIELRDQAGEFTIGRAAPGSAANDIVVMSQLNQQAKQVGDLQTTVAEMTAKGPLAALAITPRANGSEALGTLVAGSSVVLVSVDVTEPFDGDLVIQVGSKSAPSCYMGADYSDLRYVGTYVVAPTGSSVDTDIQISFSGTATIGAAKVVLQYA